MTPRDNTCRWRASVVILLVVGLLSVIYFSPRYMRESNVVYRTNTLAQPHVINATGSNPHTRLSAPVQIPTPGGRSPLMPGRLRQAQEARATVHDGNVIVQFWGKVVDQDGVPLPGARVSARIRMWRIRSLLTPESDFLLKEVVSGLDGLFEISNVKGDVLTIKELEKDGYKPEPTALRSFGYNISSNTLFSSNGPVIFRMWKEDVKVELITGDKFYSIIPDGRVYTLDLVKGTKVESSTAYGDIRIRVTRPANVTFGGRYDWSCMIEPIDGGILEEQDALSAMAIAPTEGYLPQCGFDIHAEDRAWGDAMRKRVYIKTRGNQIYGRVTIEVFAFYNLQKRDGSVGIKYCMNPSGSNILH